MLMVVSARDAIKIFMMDVDAGGRLLFETIPTYIRFDFLLEAFDFFGVLVDEVFSLSEIGFEVVELGVFAVDEFPVAIADGEGIRVLSTDD